jgi:hypothetical protein
LARRPGRGRAPCRQDEEPKRVVLRVLERFLRLCCACGLEDRELVRPIRRLLEVSDLGTEEEALDLVRVPILQRPVGDDVESHERIERPLDVSEKLLLGRARELVLRGREVLPKARHRAEENGPAGPVVVAVGRLPAVEVRDVVLEFERERLCLAGLAHVVELVSETVHPPDPDSGREGQAGHGDDDRGRELGANGHEPGVGLTLAGAGIGVAGGGFTPPSSSPSLRASQRFVVD